MSVSWGRRLASSLLAALTVAVVTHAASVVIFFVSQQYRAEAVAQVSDFYFLASLFSVVLLFVFALVGSFVRWYTALLVGFFTGILACLAGTGLNTVLGGFPLDATTIAYLWSTFLSLNGVYVLALTVAAATLGRAVYRRALAFRAAQQSGERRIALVRMPAGNLTDGQLTHLERTPVDTELADTQWDGYTSALEANGWTTREVGFADTMADSVFVEDALVLLGDTAIVARAGTESRRSESEGAEETARDLGLRIERILSPGTLEGGDVLKVGSTIYVGRSSRTNAEGIRQFRAIAAPLGYRVVAVPVTRALHLKSTMTALPDGTILGHPDLVDDPSFFPHFLAVPEREGVAVVVLSENTVLMSASAPATAALLEDRGYTVVSADISEFEKLEGCVTCLSVRVR
ncbi:MAG TPA: dimethylarginine dimethylaminohydrolase [Mycetocola sp.]|jgi:dimethylargininase|nr:dimethylarginine dimethylaminohydrolase [Mycetocola sp.]HEV7849018.1 dimethylarginine dimethylaminohydrolase [Mycetocola sp.]